MTRMKEFVKRDINSYYKYVPDVQEGREKIMLGSKMEDIKWSKSNFWR